MDPITSLALLSTAIAVALLWLYVRARGELAAANARLEAERRAAHHLKDTFTALSVDALKANSESFLQLARTELEKKQEAANAELAGRHKAIEHLVQPLQDSLTKVDTKLQQVERDRFGAQAKLDEQLRTLAQAHQSLQLETNKLVRALRSPNQRGRWGEVQLRNVIERAGLVSYCDYAEKESTQGDDGRRVTPDMIVRLPNGSGIIIDSKVPIDAYLNAADAADEGTREKFLRDHARQVREHVKALGAKAYWSRFTPTPDLVVMFVPGEPLFSTALQFDPTLFDYAVEQRVIPSSPLTLVALLRTVASAWQNQRLAENAEQIRLLGRDLYDRLATMAEYVAGLGDHLRRAGVAYDQFVGSLDARVLASARRFKDLGVTAAKEIDDIAPLHIDVREPRAPELRTPVQERLIDAVDAEVLSVAADVRADDPRVSPRSAAERIAAEEVEPI